MTRYLVSVYIGSVEVEVDVESAEDAEQAALDELCPCLGIVTDAVCAGTWTVTALGEIVG